MGIGVLLFRNVVDASRENGVGKRDSHLICLSLWPIAIRFAVVIECESDIFVQACMVVAICRRLISGGRLRYKYTKKQSFLRIHLGKRIVHVYRISRLLVIGN